MKPKQTNKTKNVYDGINKWKCVTNNSKIDKINSMKLKKNNFDI